MSQLVSFHKIEGNQNDFIVVDASTINFDYETLIKDLKKNAAKLCNRRSGIGADGILVVQNNGECIDLKVINQDGSLAGNCGNGLRCVARYFFGKRTKLERLLVSIDNLRFECTREEDEFLVSMGEGSYQTLKLKSSLKKEGIVFASKVVLGNKHVVYFCKEEVNLDYLVERVKSFSRPDENIGFCRIEAQDIRSNVFERGVGWTNACGSGACAAAISAKIYGNYEHNEFKVQQKGGTLLISLTETTLINNDLVFKCLQKGPARKVFCGEFKL